MTVTKTNIDRLVEAGRGTRFGAEGQRLCGAGTRCGSTCRKVVMRGRNRCLNHGGKSCGPTSKEGLEKIRAANTKHGQRSKAHIERVRAIRVELKLLEEIARYHGWVR
ncbi:MAG: HGGxSTG domain-containing protein [Gammaproteobacteria bacterium]|nr:HGGxSTG domain-containing protein [Gammaproteobacteria bacterium]